MKYPDAKKHKSISIVKSAMRISFSIVPFIMIMARLGKGNLTLNDLAGATACFITGIFLAEIVGIIEELV